MSLVNEISEYIRSGETKDTNLGLEIEHFVINDKGEQIGFHEVSELIRNVAEKLSAEILYMDGYPVGYATEEYTITLEPACQFEISISPYSDLDKIKEVYEKFLALWTPIFEKRGYHFETKGNLPLVETGAIDPEEITLSPKKRYKYMDAHFRRTGKFGKYMMRASASTQVSVDFSSEEDLGRKLRVLEKLSPILAIWLENKTDPDSTLPGNEGRPHLLRIQEWDDLDAARTGFFPHSLEKHFSYEQAATVISQTPLILLTDNGETADVGSQTAEDLLRTGLIRWDNVQEERKKKLIEHFISMGFFHFRVKKYIEIRVADSVPLPRALAYVALLKGIVYSEENLRILDEELSAVDSVSKIQDAVERIEKDGFGAIAYNGKTAWQWSEHLIGLAYKKLTGKDREYLLTGITSEESA